MAEYPFLLRNRIDAPMINHVKGMVATHWDSFVQNQNPSRRFFMFHDDDFVLPYKQQLASEFGITDWVQDPWFRNFIGHQTAGGAVHPHTDPSLQGRAHTRINVMISLPDSGGQPLLDGRELHLGVGDVWLNLANICTHSSTPVVGEVPRIVLSMGMQINSDHPIQQIYRNWIKEN